MTDPHAHHTDHPTGKAATATGGDTRHGDHTPEPPTQHDTHTGHGTQASHGDHAGHDGGGHGGGGKRIYSLKCLINETVRDILV